MQDHDPEIIFSDLTQLVEIDGLTLEVEIYRTASEHGWVLSVMNPFGTINIWDTPLFLADGLAWRAFEDMVRKDGLKPFFNAKERRRLRL